MHPGLRVHAREEDLEEREEAVHRVLADVGPGAVDGREPGGSVAVQHAPVHDGY